MIYTQHALSLRQQSALLELNRNRLKPKRAMISEEDHKIMLYPGEIHFNYCHMGQRNLIHELRDRGYEIGRKRVRRLIRLLVIQAMVPKLDTSKRGKAHEIYPYLLRDNPVTAANKSGVLTSLYTHA
ncbi:MAG: hypothetical protein ABGY95_03865 [Rubritalea sp.]|uniref:hypothetical protein n=1 Tax=Rubritalea sp. TaxID=2109375 RepID=UPI0032422A0A